MTTRGLSKTRIISGLQCPKRLYLQVHRPEEAETSGQSERLIQFGYGVQEVARKLQPQGKLIGNETAIGEAILQTGELLREPGDRLLFEAAFQHAGVAVRADLLSRRRGQYRLNEVKASTQVKDYHFNDAAIQRWVIEGAGYPLKSTVIMHIDNQFVYPGEGDYRGLFKEADITEETEPIQEDIPAWIKDLRKVLAGPEPKIEMGAQCGDPFECEFQAYCRRNLSPQPDFPVTLLPRGGRTVERLIEAGYTDLTKVPEDRLESTKHKRVWRVTRTGKAELDKAAATFIRGLGFPRYYLDFETIQFAVPIWAGTRPYEQLPFQWSCHVETEGGAVIHKDFLGATGEAPMRAFAESLIAALGNKGPVLVYGHFESGVLKALARRFPDLDAPIGQVLRRLTNLHTIADAHYYHRDMKGSWSLKVVLPTIAPDLDYSNLEEVQEGGAAQSAYLEVIDPRTTLGRRETLINALREYCKRDTLALVRVARHFSAS